MQTIHSFKSLPKALPKVHRERRAIPDADYRLNVLPFTPVATTKDFNFTTKCRNSWHRFSIDKLPNIASELFPASGEEKPFVYTNLEDNEEGKTIQVELQKHPSVAKAYYTRIIRDYLEKEADAVATNFLRDTQFWYLSIVSSTEMLTAYKKFTVRVMMDKNTSEPELLISYDGLAFVLKQNVKSLTSEGTFDTLAFKRVIYRKKLHYYDKLPDDALYEQEEIYPLFNQKLSSLLDLPKPYYTNKTKFTHHINTIEGFYQQYLNTPEFKKIIPHSGIWKQLDDQNHFCTDTNNNELVFGNNRTGNDAYEGLKYFGPFKLPEQKNLKILFIYLESDGECARLLHQYLKGTKGFLKLSEFIKIPFQLDANMLIKFDSSGNVVEQIQEKVNAMSLSPDCSYYAFYISPWTKYDPDQEHKAIYYKLKELMLRREIGLQVIEKEKIFLDSFPYFVANIAVAMVAKSGGIPYKLNLPADNELIVGFGAFKPQNSGIKYVGSSFCFGTDGTFKEFDCFPAYDTWAIAGSIEAAIHRYRSHNKDLNRIIIHFYKTMSRREIQPIEKMLHNLKIDIPVIILTINKSGSEDFLVFDCNDSHKIPQNGTFFNIGFDSYLLYIHGKQKPGAKTFTLPLPLKIKVKANNDQVPVDRQLIVELMTQVYHFCFMYWRSVKSSNIPVTVKYPEMAAAAFPYFDSDVLSDFGRRSLWMI
jgi:hypothetical protein